MYAVLTAVSPLNVNKSTNGSEYFVKERNDWGPPLRILNTRQQKQKDKTHRTLTKAKHPSTVKHPPPKCFIFIHIVPPILFIMKLIMTIRVIHVCTHN